MKEVQKKYLNLNLSPYSIPINMSTAVGQQQQLSAQQQHLNQFQMQNYLLSGLQLQNSSDLLSAAAMYSSGGTVYNGNMEKSLPAQPQQYQLPPDIGYSPHLGGLHSALHQSSYQAMTGCTHPYLNTSLLISNSIPQIQNIQVQNLPLLQSISTSPAKPVSIQQPLIQPQSSQDKSALASLLLEGFRNNNVSMLSLGDLSGHVLHFAQDQHGSRFIQQKLETATKDEKDKLWEELSPLALSLMTDVFGNYVIQKFVEFGSEEHQQNILILVLPHVESLTVQMYGCRVIQKLLDILDQEQRKIIFRKLEPKIEEYIKDHNGNHVVQKCIEVMETEERQVILSKYENKYVELSCHPYGCRIVQRLLENCSASQKDLLLNQILTNTDHLLLDQYGNYVIQHILEHGDQSNKSRIVERIRGRVLMLSQHKFASNVVEKCVSFATREERGLLIQEVCQEDASLGSMIRDQYGNYVVQKMIDTAGQDNHLSLLMNKIKLHAASLHKFSYGKYILAKLENYYRSDRGKQPSS